MTASEASVGRGRLQPAPPVEGDGRSPMIDGQSVPVGVGLPTLKINGITVGGTRG
jgi:hypothetical protein